MTSCTFDLNILISQKLKVKFAMSPVHVVYAVTSSRIQKLICLQRLVWLMCGMMAFNARVSISIVKFTRKQQQDFECCTSCAKCNKPFTAQLKKVLFLSLLDILVSHKQQVDFASRNVFYHWNEFPQKERCVLYLLLLESGMKPLYM